jgi:proteasome lid subunit RPN8/RPN11
MMTKPRVVSEIRRDPLERPPPRNISPHPWFSADTSRLYQEVLAGGLWFDIYMSSLAEGKIRKQSVDAAPNRLEVMGLLLGDVCSWNGHNYSIVRDVGTTDLKSTPAMVKFDPDALPRLFTSLDGAGFDYIVVGWYHSHPGHTCFMSRIDLRTQKTTFNQGFHCAVVIDPISEEVRAFKLRGDGYVEVPFALTTPGSLRVRKLKPAGRLDVRCGSQ